MLDAAPLVARAAPTGLHLVADEDGAVLAHDADGDLEVLLGRRDESTGALNRLCHEGGGAAIRFGLDQVLDVLCAADAAIGVLEAHRTAVAVGRQRVLDAGDLGRQDSPRLLSRNRDRALAAARVAVPQYDDLLLARVDLRQHDRGLIGFGPARREEAFLQLARRDLRQPFRDADLFPSGIDARGVHEPRNLILDALHEVGMRMPDAGRENAAEEIEVLAAVQVLHLRAVRLGDDDGLGVVVGDARE